MESISKIEARHLVLSAQMLENNGPSSSLHGIFQQLGYVQIDTLAVVKRTQHLVLWTRNSSYTEMALHNMLSEERSIFEYWGHAMSYLPISDYRYYLPKMEKFKNPTSSWALNHYDKCKDLLKPVLERIREEGALGAKDFKEEKQRNGSWWDWKPAKIALELLYWQGKLMISKRRNFQKIYDLRERVLPKGTDTSIPGESELARFIVKRALLAMGIATIGEILHFLQPGTSRDSDMQLVNRQEIQSAIHEMTEEGVIDVVKIEDNEKNINYVLSENLISGKNTFLNSDTLHLLSPFDNLIIQRDRLKRLFDFDYALECYLPAAKRQYGYFVMPVMWNGSFVARLDPKADRKKSTLSLLNLVFEPGFEPGEAFFKRFGQKLKAFTQFNECEKCVLKKVEPAVYREPLEKSLT